MLGSLAMKASRSLSRPFLVFLLVVVELELHGRGDLRRLAVVDDDHGRAGFSVLAQETVTAARAASTIMRARMLFFTYCLLRDAFD
jgi:hypothetical protein